MKKITIILIFIFLYLLYIHAALASSNFSTDYDVTYTIRENGTTSVNFDVVLTNKTSQYYASSYNIVVGLDDLENLRASDPNGTIVPVIIKNNDETSIDLTFNKRVVGIDNKLNFNLSFDTKSVAKKLGKIWEMNIPGLTNQDSFQSFNVYVKTPSSFGKPSYIKPAIAQSSKNSLSFTKEQLGSSGIYIGFGDSQIYRFNLKYHLKNPNLFKVKTEIAIPPPTNYQEIEIDDINPKPLNVIADNDGNWLAQYLLLPSQKIDVIVTGEAKILLNPKKEPVDREKLKEYLKEQPYWDVSNVDIKKLAYSLKTPYDIYEYIVKNLRYDFSRVTGGKARLGAKEVLKNPKSAVCLEFTDLFVTLARANGIPAREINGFAYTENEKERPLSLVKDVLHAWPEYYDYNREAWIMVDPTWGNTTNGLDYFEVLDFDHFAFVIKGESSQYPIPAGGYKLEGQEVLKDVDVTFGDTFDEGGALQVITEWNFSQSFAAGLPIQGNIIIKNVGKTFSEPLVATVVSSFLKPSPQEIFLNGIPPFGFSTLKVNFQATNALTNRTDTVTIALADYLSSESLKIYPIFLHKMFFLGGGILLAIIFTILSIIAIKTGRLPFSRQKG